MDNNIKYHFVEFDYKFCEYRNPKLYEFLEEEECDYRNTPKGKLFQRFINNSIKTFFMSDQQKEVFEKSLDLDEKKLFVLSSLFDNDFFETMESLRQVEKSDKWIVLGSKSWVKGAQESEDWCTNNNKEYETVWNLPYTDLLKKLSTAKGICFKPTGLDTCPRFVIEAKILGCELEINENVQHASEPWFNGTVDEMLEYLKNRKNVFWEIVNNG
jgi:hypothetical protein